MNVTMDTQRQLAALGRAVLAGSRPEPRRARVIMVGCWSKMGKVVRLEQHRVQGHPGLCDIAIIRMDDGTFDERALSAAREVEDGILEWRY